MVALKHSEERPLEAFNLIIEILSSFFFRQAKVSDSIYFKITKKQIEGKFCVQ